MENQRSKGMDTVIYGNDLCSLICALSIDQLQKLYDVIGTFMGLRPRANLPFLVNLAFVKFGCEFCL